MRGVKKFVNALCLLFLMGAGLMSFFLILSGARSSGTLKNFYWFEGETEGFNDASSHTRWYNYMYCGYDNGSAHDCSGKGAAKPFSPRDNFGRSDNMPNTFLNNRDTYYYLSRVGWAFLLIALFFIMITFIPVFGSVFALVKGLSIWACVTAWLGFWSIILSACLYTGCYVKARQAFHRNDRSAHLGAKNFAFIWVVTFLMLVVAIWTTILSSTHGKDREDYEYNEAYATYDQTSTSTSASSAMEKSGNVALEGPTAPNAPIVVPTPVPAPVAPPATGVRPGVAVSPAQVPVQPVDANRDNQNTGQAFFTKLKINKKSGPAYSNGVNGQHYETIEKKEVVTRR